ncbi:MAG: hypothetical protein EXR72_25845 [Myxococcales bacterium]|nr:hypothetical protein [Myxococcales bacterium]
MSEPASPFRDASDLPALIDPSLASSRPGRRRWWLIAFSSLLLIGSAVLAGLYLRALGSPATLPGLRAGGESVGGLLPGDLAARLHAIGARLLEQPVVLRFGDQRVRLRRQEVGFVVDEAAFSEAVRAVGRSGDPLADLPEWRRAQRGETDLPVPLALDRARALEVLTDLKESLDTAALDAKLDLERHIIAPERPGRLLHVYESAALLEAAARAPASAEPIELAAIVIPARVTKEGLAGIDISTVLGTWETHYSAQQIDNDRTYNLKVGAEHLNGHILKPHELFSFNEVVGNRTEKEGYRVAPVIQGGELIDGLAGGMCQIASTLHAASFFAGLEIVYSRTHSRPSAYIPLGLDATVVFPTTDLKLRNPFDFPIVMHYQVNQGTVKVELLGKARQYKVVFEREILEERGFGTGGRRDPGAPKGQRLLLQAGYPGYKAIRRRYVFDARTALPRFLGPPSEPLTTALARARIEPRSVEKWVVAYPSTEEIVAVGTGSPKLPRKPPPPPHRIPPVAKDTKPIGRIVR